MHLGEASNFPFLEGLAVGNFIMCTTKAPVRLGIGIFKYLLP